MFKREPKYHHQLANLHDTSRGWRTATYVVSAIAFGLLALTIRMDGAERVVLVPSQFSRHATGRVVVERSGAYLALLARADTASLLDWTPRTVGSQFNAFLDRCAPALYARLNTEMLADSKSYRSYDLSEVFYIRKIVFVPPNAVAVTGWLDRYSGLKQVMHALLTYKLLYNSSYAITQLEVEKHHVA